MKKLWQLLVRNTFRLLLRVLRSVSWKTATSWGRALGSLGYHVSARYRRVADRNLRNAFAHELTDADRSRLIKRVFQNFGQALFEFLKVPSLTQDEVKGMMSIDQEHFDHVDRLLAQGKGMILVSAHIGNWELLARRGAMEGYKFAVVARQSPDDGLNEVTDYIRESGGYEIYPRGGSARTVLKRLLSGGVVAILPDQKSEDVFVPFFGRLTGTVAGPAVLALKTGSPILMMFCLRRPDGTFVVESAPDVDITPTGDLEADRTRIMADITAEIEKVIRRYPDQWLWVHDRWKAPVPEHLLKPTEEAALAG